MRGAFAPLFCAYYTASIMTQIVIFERREPMFYKDVFYKIVEAMELLNKEKDSKEFDKLRLVAWDIFDKLGNFERMEVTAWLIEKGEEKKEES